VATVVTVTEAARHFADYINRVAYRGERFVLLRGNRPVAELSPVPAAQRLGDLSAVLASLPRLSPEEAVQLAHDLDAARIELEEHEVLDPWAS
jgi:antitoxin (DNA-binding transcriptional repressor) of toxin-antitoxin stability system